MSPLQGTKNKALTRYYDLTPELVCSSQEQDGSMLQIPLLGLEAAPRGLNLSDRNLECMFSDSEESEPDQLVPLRRVRAEPVKLEEPCKEELDQQESAGPHSGAGIAATTRRWKVQRTS